MTYAGFHQGRIRASKINKRLRCPFCGCRNRTKKVKREHMRVCEKNPVFNREGIKIG